MRTTPMMFVLLMVFIVSSYKMDVGKPDLPFNEISSIVWTCFFCVSLIFSVPFPDAERKALTPARIRTGADDSRRVSTGSVDCRIQIFNRHPNQLSFSFERDG